MLAAALLPWLWPLLVAPLWLLPRPLQRVAGALSPLAALPALAVAVGLPAPWSVEVPGLLLGAHFGLDATGRGFLLFTALLWLAAGLYAHGYLAQDPHRRRFFVLFLTAASGNLGVVVAQDLATFYCAFAVLTFAAYGLVVHPASAAARRAARVYLVMAVAAEAVLLVAFFLAAQAADGIVLGEVRAALVHAPQRDVVVALVLVGFGVKAGALPLHVWLPLAHPVAPTPASAVLSGCLIKAGLLGWLRFLPLGLWEAPGWGTLLVALGLLAAFYGVALGLTQRDPKTLLAYSSISQMGLINVAVGIGLTSPASWGAASGAVTLYALHHGLAKGALFLGTGLVLGRPAEGRGKLVWAVLLPALALCGAPFTSGQFAKDALKALVPVTPAPLPDLLGVLLPLFSIATTVLMGRFVLTLSRWSESGHARERRRWEWLAHAALLAAVAVTAALATGGLGLAVPTSLAAGHLWSAAWPVAVGAGLVYGLVRWEVWRFGPPVVAAGDILLLAEGVGRALASPAGALRGLLLSLDERRHGGRAEAWGWLLLWRLAHAEAALTRWRTAGVVLLAILVGALAIVLGGTR